MCEETVVQTSVLILSLAHKWMSTKSMNKPYRLVEVFRGFLKNSEAYKFDFNQV